jgi:DNA-binding CsgD family transcriptional regulator
MGGGQPRPKPAQKRPTVATLRRRAYDKLNISSLNQLFARCMEQLARGR